MFNFFYYKILIIVYYNDFIVEIISVFELYVFVFYVVCLYFIVFVYINKVLIVI